MEDERRARRPPRRAARRTASGRAAPRRRRARRRSGRRSWRRRSGRGRPGRSATPACAAPIIASARSAPSRADRGRVERRRARGRGRSRARSRGHRRPRRAPAGRRSSWSLVLAGDPGRGGDRDPLCRVGVDGLLDPGDAPVGLQRRALHRQGQLGDVRPIGPLSAIEGSLEARPAPRSRAGAGGAGELVLVGDRAPPRRRARRAPATPASERSVP